jgi:hypothetical protein
MGPQREYLQSQAAASSVREQAKENNICHSILADGSELSVNYLE